MNPSTRPRVRPADAVHTRVFDGELVILDLRRGEYFALDTIGTRLWCGLEAGRSLHELAGEISGEYDVTADEVCADLVHLENELIARGLLVTDEPQPEHA